MSDIRVNDNRRYCMKDTLRHLFAAALLAAFVAPAAATEYWSTWLTIGNVQSGNDGVIAIVPVNGSSELNDCDGDAVFVKVGKPTGNEANTNSLERAYAGSVAAIDDGGTDTVTLHYDRNAVGDCYLITFIRR